MHINRVKVNDFYVSYDLKNVDKRIEAVATFTKAGEIIHKIYNIGNFDYCAKLLDNDFAKNEAEKTIETANRSVHSPFK